MDMFKTILGCMAPLIVLVCVACLFVFGYKYAKLWQVYAKALAEEEYQHLGKLFLYWLIGFLCILLIGFIGYLVDRFFPELNY